MKVFYRNIHKNTIVLDRSKQEKQAKYNRLPFKKALPMVYEAVFPLYMLYRE